MNISRYIKHYNLLFSPDLLQRVARHSQKWCTDKDFPVDKGLSVRDEAQRAFRITRGAWQAWSAGNAAEGQLPFINTILSKVLGYDTPFVCPDSGIPAHVEFGNSLFSDELPEQPIDSTEPHYPVTLLLSNGENRFILPVIVVPPNCKLDAKYSFLTGHRLSATQMMQAYLNASEQFMWAIVTNGSNWRLLRDNPALSRPCYLDLDLDLILQDGESQVFDSMFWRVFHVSRAAWLPRCQADSCLWEQWRQDLEEHGARAREGLRDGVEQAICALGTGFIRANGPGNDRLRSALTSGELSIQSFYQELMRAAYRLIFLSVLEERKLLHAHAPSLHSAADLYRKGFSLARLTNRTLRADQELRHDDLWQAQLIVFASLGQDGGQPALALPALGGLFDSSQCPHLDSCRLSNCAFLSALNHLRWSTTDNKRTLIDYANMDAEELGSVYESLLELTPRIAAERQFFYFMGSSSDPEQSAKRQKGNARKTTGSYYTPACLVEQVLKTALDPLLDDCCKNPFFAQQRLRALRIIDPACGSGHFLLGAARRIAERLAAVRTQGQIGYTPQVYQQAMHDVIRECIYGVDINPMAIELVRMNLWLEGYQPGKALSFLDAHLRCGNSLLGIFSEETLEAPIPGDAFKCNPGDDAAVCKLLKASNAKAVKARDKSDCLHWEDVSTTPEDSICEEEQPSQVKQQAEKWYQEHARRQNSQKAIAADIWLGAFLTPKRSPELVPTTHVLDLFAGHVYPADLSSIVAARTACREAKAFHWFLEFPEIFAQGGFDCVLGNPPWERMKIQEKEWFSSSCPQISECAKTADRHKLIAQLERGELPHMSPDLQRTIFAHYQKDLRITAATSLFVHTPGDSGGRYPLSGVGDVNMYALFAETNYSLKAESGRAGFIVPTGIATDAATSAFFGNLVKEKVISSLYDLENRAKLFPEVDSRQRFCCFTLAPSDSISVACYLTHPRQLEDQRRIAHMSIEDFARINPNTGTCPLFRCEADAELTVKLYRKAPILINEKTGENPWGVKFGTLFHMSNDSHLFLTEKPAGEDVLPLYEGKLIHHYDHRYNAFLSTGGDAPYRPVEDSEKKDFSYELEPRYWVKTCHVVNYLPKHLKSSPPFFIGFRKTCRATDNRTLITSFVPFAAASDKLQLIFSSQPTKLLSCLVANANSIPLDYIVRQKLGGTDLTYLYMRQFPFLPPSAYTAADIAYISSRVLELSYTSYSMRPLAEALGYTGEPFPWDEDRRAQLKAELDAYYAKLYGLTREELEYILDPTTKYPTDCPTVTFPTLQNNEMKKYGEYRTQRLVLAAFDELTRKDN